MSGLGFKVTGQLDILYLNKTILIRFRLNISRKYYDFGLRYNKEIKQR